MKLLEKIDPTLNQYIDEFQSKLRKLDDSDDSIGKNW